MSSPFIWAGNYAKSLKGLLNLNDSAYIIQGTVDPSASAQNAPQGSIYLRTGGSGGSVWMKQDAGSSTNWTPMVPSGATNNSSAIVNAGLSASFAANAMTVNLVQGAGSTPSSGSGAVSIAFRNSTLATGQYTVPTVTAALSVVVSSSATLGTTSGKVGYVYVYAINNAGTIELAVAGSSGFNESVLQTTTTMSGSATSATVLYSTTGRSNVPVRLLGWIISNQATAGTWVTAPTNITLQSAKENAPVAFSAFGQPTGTLSAATNIFKFSSGQVNTDTNSGYDTSTGLYTVQVPGLYCGTVGTSVAATWILNNELDIGIGIDGTVVVNSEVRWAAASTSSEFTAGASLPPRFLKAGQTIGPYSYTNAAASPTFSPNDTYSYFGVWLYNGVS